MKRTHSAAALPMSEGRMKESAGWRGCVEMGSTHEVPVRFPTACVYVPRCCLISAPPALSRHISRCVQELQDGHTERARVEGWRQQASTSNLNYPFTFSPLYVSCYAQVAELVMELQTQREEVYSNHDDADPARTDATLTLNLRRNPGKARRGHWQMRSSGLSPLWPSQPHPF